MVTGLPGVSELGDLGLLQESCPKLIAGRRATEFPQFNVDREPKTPY